MTNFAEFSVNCKMRYDFGDMIQVRYRHTDGENYDTWVSGEEVLQRLRSQAAEARLKGLSRLDWQQLQEAKERLPDDLKESAQQRLLDILANGMDDAIGGNVIGDNLADAVRNRDREDESSNNEKKRWVTYLQDEQFCAKLLELAWIQLEGSSPEMPEEEPDDWL